MSDLDSRLKQALADRDRLESEINRIDAKREVAQTALESVITEIKSKGLDPENLDKTVQDLERAYALEVEKLEAEVASAEKAIAPFRGL
jgi:chromosome segregation ATPase